jgi:hypothetical protein
MKHTIVKKYRIEDYSRMSNLELLKKFKYFNKKQKELSNKRLDHKYVKEQFSVMLNLHNIMEQFYLRNPELKDSIDFDAEVNEIIKNNAINASKN